MEPAVKVQEEEERVAENQEVRVWGTWNPHDYPVVQDLEDGQIYCYGIHAPREGEGAIGKERDEAEAEAGAGRCCCCWASCPPSSSTVTGFKERMKE